MGYSFFNHIKGKYFFLGFMWTITFNSNTKFQCFNDFEYYGDFNLSYKGILKAWSLRDKTIDNKLIYTLTCFADFYY